MKERAGVWQAGAMRTLAAVSLTAAMVGCGGGGEPGGAAATDLNAKTGADVLGISNSALDADGAVFTLSARQSSRVAPVQQTTQIVASEALASAPAIGVSGNLPVSPSTPTSPAVVVAQPLVAPVVALPPVARVVSIVKVGETRVDRTTYDYTFKVVLESPAKSIVQATSVVQSVGEGTSVMDGSAIFDAVTAGARATSKDTITLRHDRSKPFNSAAVTWGVRTFAEPTRPPVEAVVQRAVLDPALLDGNGTLTADSTDPLLLVDGSGTFGAMGSVLLFDGTVRRIRDIQTGANGQRVLVTQELPATAAFKDLAFTATVNPLAALMMMEGGATIQTAPESLGRKFSQSIKRLLATPATPPFLDFVTNNRFACFLPSRVVESESGELEVRWEIDCTTAQLGAAFGKSWPNIGGFVGHYLQKTSQTYKLDRAIGDDYTVTNDRSELAFTLATNARVAANQLPLMNEPGGRCEKKGTGVECEWALFKKPTFARTYAVLIAGVPVPVTVEVRPKFTLEISGEGTIKGMRVTTRETISGVRSGVKLPEPDDSTFSDAGSTPLVDATYGAAAALEFSGEIRLLMAGKVDIGSLKYVSDTSLSSIEVGGGGYARASREFREGRDPCFSAQAGGVASLSVSFLDSAFLRNLGLFDGIKVLELERLWTPDAAKTSSPNGCAETTDAARLTLGYVIVGRNNYKADAAQSSLGRDVYVASGDWLLEKKAVGGPIVIDFTKVFTENIGFRNIALDDLVAEVPGIGPLAASLTVSRNPLDGKVYSALYSIRSSQVEPGNKLLVTASTYQDEDGKRERTRATRLIRIDFERPPQATASYEFVRKPNGAAEFSVVIAYADEATRLALASARVERGDGTQESVGRSFELDGSNNSIYMLKSLQRITRNGLDLPVRPFDDDEAQRPKWLLLETPTTEGIAAVYRVPITVDSQARVDGIVFANRSQLHALDAVKLTVLGHNLPFELPLDAAWCSNLKETEPDAEMVRAGVRSTVEREYTCTATRLGEDLSTTALGYSAAPQNVKELTGLEVRGPVTVTQGEASDFSVLAARFSDYARNLVTVLWNFGEGVVREVQGLAQQVSYAFAAAGDRFISLVYQAFGERIGGEPGKQLVVQPGAGGITVTAVTPLTAVAGVARTFDVIGSNMPLGLSFNLDGCPDPTEVQVGTSPSLRRFTCTFAPTAAEGEYEGNVASSSNVFGSAPYVNFKVLVSRVTVGTALPAQTIRSIATSFEFRGENLPITGITVVPVGDDRSNCQEPTNPSVNGFGVACELFKVGAQVLEVRHSGQVLGSSTVNVASNVTGVTWTSASTNNSGTVKFGETVMFTVRGENLNTDPLMGFAVEKCGVSNTEVGVAGNTARTFTCFFNNEAGAVAGLMPGVVKDKRDGQGQVLLDGWRVPVEVPAPPSNLTVSIDHLLNPPPTYDNADQAAQVYGQTFTALHTNVSGVAFLFGDPTRQADTRVNEMTGPFDLKLYEVGAGGAVTLLASERKGSAASVQSGLVTLRFSAPPQTVVGRKYFVGVLAADAFGLGLRSTASSTYPGGAEAWITAGASTVTEHFSGRDTSFQVMTEQGVPAGVTDTLEAAFSLSSSLRGPWSFGWQTSNGAAPTPYGKFTPAGTLLDFPTLAMWNKGDGTEPASVYPYVYKNTGASPVFYTAGVTEFPSQSVIVTPGSAGERAVFRWTAPAAGAYEISARFELMQGGSVDVRVQKNGTDLFVQQISGAGSVSMAPAQTVVLNAGEAIDFAVGNGGNTNHSDITRVAASVTRASPGEESAWCGKTLDFAGNQLPPGWQQVKVRSGPGIGNERLQGSPTNSGAEVVSPSGPPIPGTARVVAKFRVNTSYAYWGQHFGVSYQLAGGRVLLLTLNQARYNFGDGTLAMTVQDLSNTWSSLAATGTVFAQARMPGYRHGLHEVTVAVTDGQVNMLVKNLDAPTVSDISFSSALPPAFKVADVRRALFQVYTTTDGSIWGDDLSFQCLP